MKREIDEYLESLERKKFNKALIAGVGVNDSPFQVWCEFEGKRYCHSGYQSWNSMINRCYSPSARGRFPTYIGCSVDHEWHSFSSFLSWWKENYVYGWDLDKDLLVPGNRVYSSKKCVFIPKSLNLFLGDRRAARGSLPIGVHYDKTHNKFVSQINVAGKVTFIGHFEDPLSAHEAWHKRKLELALQFRTVCDEIHPELFNGLMVNLDGLRLNREN